MAKKSTTMKRSRKVKKTASERRIGTAAGATQREFPILNLLEGDGPIISNNTLVQGDRILNLSNRRLHRQHKVYTMKVGLVNPNSTSPLRKVFVLQNTWWTRKAMKLAKHIYDEAVSEERAVVGSSRWHDFRIGSQTPSSSAAFPAATQLDGTVPTYTQLRVITEGTSADGEYQFSNIETTDATGAAVSRGFNCEPFGQDYNIFEQYNLMGPDTMNDPVFVAQGGYDRATGTSFEAENVQDLLNDGNLPPYNAGDLPFRS